MRAGLLRALCIKFKDSPGGMSAPVWAVVVEGGRRRNVEGAEGLARVSSTPEAEEGGGKEGGIEKEEGCTTAIPPSMSWGHTIDSCLPMAIVELSLAAASWCCWCCRFRLAPPSPPLPPPPVPFPPAVPLKCTPAALTNELQSQRVLTLIFPCVKVPVLSVHSTVIAPMVGSSAQSFTRILFLASY